MITASENGRPLIIYGNGSSAHAFGQYFLQDNKQKIAAYTVDKKFITSDKFQGSPLISFDEIKDQFPAQKNDMIIPLGYWEMNHLRERLCEETKLMGYQLISYRSPKSVIADDVALYENTIIYESAIIRGSTTIEANVIINAGANIGYNSFVGKNSFIAAGAITGGNVNIGNNCVIGLGAILRDGITIASDTFIGAGSVVTANINESGLFYGNPARRQLKSPFEACK